MVKCSICSKECTGYEAGVHTRETGHNLWELLFEDTCLPTLETENDLTMWFVYDKLRWKFLTGE